MIICVCSIIFFKQKKKGTKGNQNSEWDSGTIVWRSWEDFKPIAVPITTKSDERVWKDTHLPAIITQILYYNILNKILLIKLINDHN